MLDETEVSSRQDILFHSIPIVEPAHHSTQAISILTPKDAMEKYQTELRNLRDFLGIDNQPRMSAPEITFQFRLDRRQLPKRWSHFTQDPGSSDIGC